MDDNGTGGLIAISVGTTGSEHRVSGLPKSLGTTQNRQSLEGGHEAPRLISRDLVKRKMAYDAPLFFGTDPTVA
jgi:hypothetical protein